MNLTKSNRAYHEENLQLQSLLSQLKDENMAQRSNIERIIEQLRTAQSELRQYSNVY